MPERRRHGRAQVEATVEFRGSYGLTGATIADMSMGGLRLLLERPERPGTPVHLTVRFSNALDSAAFESGALVVWARQSPPYLAGVRWVQQDESRDDMIGQGLRLDRHINN